MEQEQNLNQMPEQFLSGGKPSNFPDGFPCGVMQCTCEKYPKVLYANTWMFSLMGVDGEGTYWREFLRDNVFFMIPQEQWPGFRQSLERACLGETVALEHSVKTSEGREIPLMGWVRTINPGTEQEAYQFLYVRLHGEQIASRKRRETAYLSLLGKTYDGIFKIERNNRIVECLSIGEKLNTGMYFVRGIRVVMDCMLQKSYYSMVYEDDRPNVEEFFHRAAENSGNHTIDQVEFRTLGDGILREFIMYNTELDEDTALICCKDVTQERSAIRRMEEMDQMKSIRARLEEQSQNPSMDIETYRIVNHRVFLRSGESSYLTSQGLPLEEFLEKAKIAREEYDLAMEKGEVLLASAEKATGNSRHLYIARRNIPGVKQQERMLLIYQFRNDLQQPDQNTPRVTIRTFGFFDVLVDGKPIVFPHEKSKEMLALMVDRKGSFVGNPYFISCLWEDEPYGEKIQSRCRQTAFRMMETLKRYGIEDIIEKVDGHRRVIPEKVNCDYFDYINGTEGAKQLFNGSYMSDYSWGEETLSTLLRTSESGSKTE